MRKVIGVGETILDILFKNGQPFRAVPGGSVFNGFVSLSRAGIPVEFISELGRDKIGQIIRDFMDENGLTTDYVDCFPMGKSPISLAFLDDDRNAEYLFYKDYPSQRLEVMYPKIEANDIFIFGSYYALNPALRGRILELLEYAAERKAIIYYDPNFRNAHAHEAMKLKSSFLENFEFSDIIRGSDEDFKNIFGHADMREIYENEIRFYCNTLITTNGDRGVDLFYGNNSLHIDSESTEVASTIGAGDNFNAGILLGLIKHHVYRENLKDMTEEDWEKVIRCGIDFATESCKTYENYVSREFAAGYMGQ